MSSLPADFLVKKGGRYRPVSLSDVVTMLHNIREGAAHPVVGFEDAARTLEELEARLSKKVLYEPTLIESALWSCNLMNEAGAFWDLKGRSFDEFVKSVVGRDSFNRTYNFIKEAGE